MLLHRQQPADVRSARDLEAEHELTARIAVTASVPARCRRWDDRSSRRPGTATFSSPDHADAGRAGACATFARIVLDVCFVTLLAAIARRQRRR